MTKPYVDHVAIRSRNFERDLSFSKMFSDLKLPSLLPRDLTMMMLPRWSKYGLEEFSFSVITRLILPSAMTVSSPTLASF